MEESKMIRIRLQPITVLPILLALCCTLPSWSQSVPERYTEVLKYLGKTGDFKDDVLKVSVPRNDLHVTVDGISLPTSFGFGGWLGMTTGDKNTEVMMGDLVLLQDEVNPVMTALLDSGIEVTALHNHFFWENPRIFYMHVHAHGTALDLARRVKPALDLMGTVPPKQEATSEGTMHTEKLATIIGHTGERAGPVYKVTIGRDDLKMKEMGARINARMGLNTWAAFAGSDTHAVVAGDVAMLQGEVTNVLKALRSHGLNVVAIHNHMIGSEPAVFFLHYWGTGSAEALAKGFRAALDQLGRPQSH
jgi:hypothetical protein